MRRSKFLAWLISLGMISSPALAVNSKHKRESEDATALIMFFTYGKLLHEVVGYSNEYKTGIDKLTVGYAVKKFRKYYSKEAIKERLRQKLKHIIEESGLKQKLGHEGRVDKLLRAEMRDKDFVDFMNNGNINSELGIPKMLTEQVVDEMLAVTTMSDKEKSFVKDNVNFYLCAVRSLGLWGFEIYGFLKSYDFLESYKKNPLIIQDRSASTSDELVREINSNEVVHVCFSDGQLMNGDYYTQQYEIKPLKILKKVNGKLVLEDENKCTIEKNEMVKEFFENL